MRSRKIMGKNAVFELFVYDKQRFLQIYTSSKDLLDFYTKEKIPSRLTDRTHLNRLVQSESHQGIVAEIREREPLFLATVLEQLEKKEHSLLLLLDHIQDPQNFGSILRVAECFGVDLVIYSTNQQVSVTPTVSKVSMAASEIVPMISVGNLRECAKFLQTKGYWLVGTTPEKKGNSLYDFDFPNKTVLLLGSEGEGVGKQLLDQLDYRIQIPMEGVLESLNVATAASACLAIYRAFLSSNKR